MTEKIFSFILSAAILTIPQAADYAAAQSISIGEKETAPQMRPAQKPGTGKNRSKSRSDYTDEDEFERIKPQFNPDQGKRALFSGDEIHGSYIPETAPFNPKKDIFKNKKKEEEIQEDISDTAHKTWRKMNKVFTRLSFNNFNGDSLVLNFSMYESEYNMAINRYGYSQIDMNSMCSTFKSELDNKDSRRQPATESSDMLFYLPEDCLPKAKSFLAKRGINLDINSKTMYWDLPFIAKREKNNVIMLAEDLRKKAAERNYGKREIAGAILSMVQSAIKYKEQPAKGNKRSMLYGGIYTPLQTIVEGHGDCDTKSLLMATMLSHWPSIKVIGIQVPDHYFLGISVPAKKGDETITYFGIKYVLVEPAGPAWLPPGTIAPHSRKALTRSYTVQEF